MKVFDPLVSIEPSAQARLRGWAVAAAIIARLQEVGLSGGIDVPAILGPAISDLSEADLQSWPGNQTAPSWIRHDTFLATTSERVSCGQIKGLLATSNISRPARRVYQLGP